MNHKIRHILFSLCILSWSAVILYFYASGRVTKYLAPDFRIISLLGGMGLGVLGLFNLLSPPEDADGHDGCDHTHHGSDLHPALAVLLMLFPVVFSAIQTRDSYSMATLSRKGLYEAPKPASSSFLAALAQPLTVDVLKQTHRISKSGYYEFNLLELYYHTGDREMQQILDGLKIETEGRWVEEKVASGVGRKRLYRLFMTCCAADSKAIPLALEVPDHLSGFKENTWVKAEGVIDYRVEDQVMQAVLIVERMSECDPPYEESFLRY
jgi:uncharacterized repeat protein (TIGR03943 family)